jgi:hypothetical protein
MSPWWRSTRSRHRAGPHTAALALLLLATPLFAGGAGPSTRGPAASVPPASPPTVGDRQPAGQDGGVVRAGAGFFTLRPVPVLAGAPLEAGGTRRFRVAGTPAGVPGEGVVAVALNVEIAAGPKPATVTLFPAGTEPSAAAVTVAAGAGRVASAFTIQRLPPAGELDVRGAGGPVDVTVRVRGYYAAPCAGGGATWRPVQPMTLMDTTVQPRGTAVALVVGAGAVQDAGLQAATVEVEAGGALAPGRLQVHPSGIAPPDDAALAFAPGRDASVLEVTSPGGDGKVGVTNHSNSAVKVRLRLVGYYARGGTLGSAYQALDPSRLLVTTLRAGAPVALRVAGVGGQPGGGTATPELAVAASDPTLDGELTIASTPGGQPAATIGLHTGEGAAGTALPQPGPDGRVWLSVTAGSVTVLVWARGWFGAPAPLTVARDVATSMEFDRRGATEPGWTGGSVSAPVGLPRGGTAWLFGETFLGVLRPDGSQPPRAPGPPRGKGPLSALVHNSIVVQGGAKPTTHVGPVDRATGYPRALLRPAAGTGTGDRWYWPGSGLVEGGTLRVFVYEFQQRPGGYAWTGRNRLVSLRLPGMTVAGDSPLAGTDQGSNVQWGAAVLEEASHTYVYGLEELHGSGAKRAHVARFPRGAATGAWQFWDGTGWVADPAASAPLTGPGGTDPVAATPGTVARLGAGYILLTVADLGKSIDVRTSCSPVGPWGPARPLYQIPELRAPRNAGDSASLPRGYVSGDGLLVAYNLNAGTLGEAMGQMTYYRPRFIRVR